MNLLLVAATWNEIKPLEKFLEGRDAEGKLHDHAVEICVTGIGGVQTAFHLGKILSTGKWDLAVQLGICGSFKKEFPIGATVNVVEECFADLGAEDGEIFLDAFEIGLLDADKFPFENGWTKNKSDREGESKSEKALVSKLPKVRGISVNKVHGNEKSIQQIISKYDPDVESMEGAAFFYCCKMASVPFIELRTVSNFVERRDRSKWNIEFAVENLNEVMRKLIEELISKENPS